MITSFDLMWMDCSCHSVDSLSTEKTTVHRKHCNIMCAQYDGHNQVLKSGTAQIELSEIEKLFELIDSLISDLKSNDEQYNVQVCDGSRWVLRIHNSDRSVQKYEGTVFYTLWQMLHHVRAYHVRIQWKSMLIHWLVILLESSALRRMLLLIIPEFYRENELLCAAVMIVYAFVCNTYPVMRRWPVITIHAIILLVTFFLQPMQVSFGAWWNYVAVILVLLFQHWAGQYNYRAIPTSAVQQGMILSADTILRFSRSRVHGLSNDASESMTARLTDIQAAAVKRWESSANGAVEITIVRKMPFAILISIGFFLWMMIRIVR